MTIEVSTSLVNSVMGWGILIFFHVLFGLCIVTTRKKLNMIIVSGIILFLVWVVALTQLGIMVWVS